MSSKFSRLLTNRRLFLLIFVCVCLIGSMAILRGPGALRINTAEGEPAEANIYASPVALALDSLSNQLYVAEQTSNSVADVDLDSKLVVRRFNVNGPVFGLTIAVNKLYVTSGQADGWVDVFGLGTGQLIQSMSVGHTPMSPKVTSDGQWLVLCNRYNNNVAIKSLTSNDPWVHVPVPREPVAVALTPDNTLAVVANHIQAGRSDVNFVAPEVSLIDRASQSKITDISLPNGSSGVRDVCISPDGHYAYVTHLIGRYQMPTTQVDRGWMNTNALSIIDLQSRTRLTTVLLDDVDMGAANPWGVTCSPDGKLLLVSISGTHELYIIDRIALHAKIEQAEDPGKIQNDLNFLHDLRQRLPLSGQGPRGAAVMNGDKLYVPLYFADVVDVIEYSTSTGARLEESIALGPEPVITQVRQGEMRFHDAVQSFQRWQTCASCHPDGFTDGLNWDLLNDGVGNSKNAKSLLLSHYTPPVMSSGIRPDAQTAVRAGLRYIEFVAIDENDANALDAYLSYKEPIPSPYLVGGQLSTAAQRGENIFHSAGCGFCHSGQYFTDLKSYNVGTGIGREEDWLWDTPTLINVWKTAPYLHDGRAVTIRDVLTVDNPNDEHGMTSTLTEQEIDDLVEYILSL
ncbi:MAG: c-type cytochrome [Gammaproteobacteria bacterium]